MLNLTQSQKDDLAMFAGGTLHISAQLVHKSNLAFWDFKGKRIAWYDWSPADKPAHGDLVMRALVERMGWGWVREEVFALGWMANKADKDASWFWPAVCDAALKVIEQKGR